MSKPDYSDPDWSPKGLVSDHCHYFSTDQPGVGHCYWCADGGLCPTIPAWVITREWAREKN